MYWTYSTTVRGVAMIVIVGLVVLLVAAIVGFTGVLTNAGPDHSVDGELSPDDQHKERP